MNKASDKISINHKMYLFTGMQFKPHNHINTLGYNLDINGADREEATAFNLNMHNSDSRLQKKHEHPCFLDSEREGNAHGLVNNLRAMDVILVLDVGRRGLR